MKIETCPYCHEDEAILRQEAAGSRMDYFVECQFCLARGPSDFNKSQALGSWNIISKEVLDET